MPSVNKVILIGNLGRDPEIRDFANGNQFCTLSVATTVSWIEENGDRLEKTEWHRVAIYNQSLIDIARQQLVKGSKVYVEGQLQTNKYTDRNGIVRYSTQVVISKFKGVLVPVGRTRSVERAKPINQRELHSDQNKVTESRSKIVYNPGITTESYVKYLRRLENELEPFMGDSRWSDNLENRIDYDVNLDDVDSDWYL